MTDGTVSDINILGTKIAAFNLDSAVEQIGGWIEGERVGRYVCVTGVHGVMESHRNEEIRRAHNKADACVPDGMPLTWVGRLNGYRSMDRVYGPDLMLRILDHSVQKGYSHFFYGGAEGVAEDLKCRMKERCPGLNVVGTFCPPFRPLTSEEKETVISIVNETLPDVLWVGLSTPKQELFMSEFHEKIRAKVAIGVGAAFDFHTGRVRQAPRWVMRTGFEWLFRLFTEPRRLAPRYLRNNPAFIWNILLQQTGLKNY